LTIQESIRQYSAPKADEKLKGFEINGKLLQWLESSLTPRTMRVMLRGNLFTDSGGVEWISTR